MTEKVRTSDRNIKTAEKIFVRIKDGRETVMGYDLWCIVEELSKRDRSLLETDPSGKNAIYRAREKAKLK